MSRKKELTFELKSHGSPKRSSLGQSLLEREWSGCPTSVGGDANPTGVLPRSAVLLAWLLGNKGWLALQNSPPQRLVDGEDYRVAYFWQFNSFLAWRGGFVEPDALMYIKSLHASRFRAVASLAAVGLFLWLALIQRFLNQPRCLSICWAVCVTADCVVSACVCVSISQLWAVVVCLSTDTVAWNGPRLPTTGANLFLSWALSSGPVRTWR